jgi:hypothetical protein
MKHFRPIALFFVAVAFSQELATAAEPIRISGVASSATKFDYLQKMIASDEKDEALIDEAFNAFISLLANGEIKKGELRLPAHLTSRDSGMVAFERAFYLTPNVLRSFELIVPVTCLKQEGGLLISVSDLVVSHRGGTQGSISLALKPKEPNSGKVVGP